MKKIILTIAACLALAASSNAGIFDSVIKFGAAADEAKGLTFAFSPSYATDIVVDGEKAPWGVCAAALYPVVDIGGVVQGATGARIDWFARELWLPSLDVTLTAPFTFLGKIEVTPFVVGGAIFPLNQANSNGETVGGIYGAGIGVTVLKWQRGEVKGSLALGCGVERWTPYESEVYRVGCALSFKF